MNLAIDARLGGGTLSASKRINVFRDAVASTRRERVITPPETT